MSTFLLGSFFPSCKPIHLTYFLLLFLSSFSHLFPTSVPLLILSLISYFCSSPHSLTYDCVSDFFTFDLSNRTDSRRNYNCSLHTLKIVAECRFVTFIHVERERKRGRKMRERQITVSNPIEEILQLCNTRLTSISSFLHNFSMSLKWVLNKESVIKSINEWEECVKRYERRKKEKN